MVIVASFLRLFEHWKNFSISYAFLSLLWLSHNLYLKLKHNIFKCSCYCSHCHSSCLLAHTHTHTRLFEIILTSSPSRWLFILFSPLDFHSCVCVYVDIYVRVYISIGNILRGENKYQVEINSIEMSIVTSSSTKSTFDIKFMKNFLSFRFNIWTKSLFLDIF